MGDFVIYYPRNSTQYAANSSTINIVRIVSIPLCPDLVRYDQLGEADNLRGRVVRVFFWLMRVWPV